MFKLIFLLLLLNGYYKSSDSLQCNRTFENTALHLKSFLLCDYDKTVLPISPGKNKTQIAIWINTLNYNYEESQQTFIENILLGVGYKDANLRWDPLNWTGIKFVEVDENDVWMPKLVLDNSFQGTGVESCRKMKCGLTQDGEAMCIYACNFRSLCEGNFKRWPYDKHVCIAQLGILGYTGDKIDFSVIDVLYTGKYRVMNTEWKLTSVKYDRTAVLDLNDTVTPWLNFRFMIERHSHQDEAMVLAPAIALLVINLISFNLDLRSVCRIIFLTLTIFTEMTFLKQLSWYVPKNGDVIPTIIIFYRNLLVLTMSLLLETYILRAIGRLKKDPHKWVPLINGYVETFYFHDYFSVEKINNEVDLEHDYDELTDFLMEIDTTNNYQWKLLARFIDRVLLGFYVIYYLIMFIILMSDTSYE